ncbi:MAG: PD-(D/E)XK nuclease family protein [Verrucomicrobiia bacterium]
MPCGFAALREKKHVQARFLLGPAGSGKTFRCLAEVRAALAAAPAGPPLILLAPKQATFQLERQLLAGGALTGYTRLHIFSFERLARFVLAALGVPPPSGVLAEEGRVMVMRALLLRHGQELQLFRSSARRSGFARQVSQLLGELQQHQYTPAKVHALTRRPGLSRELQHKLHDLALLLESYTRWLTDHGLQDGNRLLDAATEALRNEFKIQNSKFKIETLWLDGFAEMTPQELDLLAAVLPACHRATLAFCLESEPGTEPSWLSIWSPIGKTFERCRQRIANSPGCEISIEQLKRNPLRSRFTGNPALQHLETSWATPRQSPDPGASTPASSVRLVACPIPEVEVAFAAREILKFVRRGGRFRDCAVLVRNIDGYHQPLARAFRRYDIPCFLDRRESVAHHPLAELTRNALRTVAFDWSPDDWFAALKAGFSPVEETEIDRLENESLARGWHGAQWREPLHIPENPELAGSLERLRKKILPPFEDLARQLARFKNSPTGGQLAETLRAFWSEMKVEQTLERWSLGDPENSSPVNRQSSIHPTVGEQMDAWLDNVELAFADEALPLREWLPVLEAGLANLTVGVIPPALDQVLVGAIDRARNPDLKLALVLGLNESVFPAAPSAPVILTDTDREEMGASGVALGPDLRERLARERYLGYIACTRAAEKLIVTFSRQDADGKSLNPSPFSAHLRRIFPGLEIEAFSGAVKLDEAEHVSELFVPLVQFCGSGRASAHSEKSGISQSRLTSGATTVNWESLLELPALKNLTGALAALREPDSTEGLSPALAERLFGPTLHSSVSRLEQFAACPFRFFVHSGLHAKERKVFALDAREQGSFQHEVLKVFHGQLRAEHKRWRDLAPADARARVGKIAAVLAVDYRDGLLRANEESRFTARVLAESLQDFVETLVGWMRGQYEFDPVVAELGFGFDAGGAPAWEIDLGQGRKLALRGRIDRIDLCPDPDGGAQCVVMDYKSGRQKLDPVLVAHGVQLQLLAYLAAARRWPDPQTLLGAQRVIPAGVFYVNLRGQYESGQTRDEALADRDGARKRAYRHTGRFDVSALPNLDRAQAADQFNYRLNKDGSVRANSTQALPGEKFKALLDRVEAQLQEMGRAIFSGAAQVDPYRKGRETPCEFCDYRAACRIDPWTHQYRVLRAVPEETDAANQ